MWRGGKSSIKLTRDTPRDPVSINLPSRDATSPPNLLASKYFAYIDFRASGEREVGPKTGQ